MQGNTPITWRSFILSLYPDALRRTYCVPPVHFNRVPYVRDTVPGTGLSALVLPVSVTPPVHNVPPASQPSGSATPVHNVPPVSQPSGSAEPVHKVPPVSQPSGSATPVHNVPPVSQPSGSAEPVHKVPPVSQPSGSATPVHNVPPVSQPSGSAEPVHKVPPVSLPSGSAEPVHNVPPVSQPSGSAEPVHSVPPVSQPSGSATPVHNVPPVSQPSGSAAPVHNVPPVSQPSGSAAPVHKVPRLSQPSGSATPVHNVPPVSQPSGSPAPVHNVPPVSQPSGSAEPVHSVPPVSQPSGSAAPVHNVPPVSQPSGSAAPVHNVPPVSQPSGSAAPVHKVPQLSQPSGSAAPVHNAPPVSQLLNLPTQYSLWTQEPQPPATPLRVQESDFRDDHCQQFVLKNLQALGNTGQVMFILSQFHYGSYLNKPSYAAATAQLPRPITMEPAYREGDFDVLVIHQSYGVLIGEVKTVGMNQAYLNRSAAQADSMLAKRVRQAVKQLNKSETVLRHLVSDIAPDLTEKKTIFLPYVSKAQLQRVLTVDPLLEQEVCRSLGAGNAADAVRLCCCSDQLSDPATYWDVTPASLSQLTCWWQHRMACTTHTGLTDDIYLDILARFVGPATSVTVYSTVPPRVEVRTEGEAVAALGQRLACLVLTQQQLDVMHRSPPRVFLAGPPGTGKTILLVLQGLRLLRQGRHVDVVSIHPDTLAASIMIQHQLQMTLSADSTTSPTPGTVRLHQYDFSIWSDVDRAVGDLLSVVQDDTLCVLVDEVNTLSPCSDQGLQRLVSELTGRVTHLYLWCAGVFHTAIPPALQAEVLTMPLRSAPAVMREVQSALGVWSGEGLAHDYSNSGLPAPGDGPSVVHLRHCGPCHTCQHPVDCVRCGHDVAALLRRLGVGTGGLESCAGSAPLSYRDVFILTGYDELRDDVIDDAGRVTSPASGFVRGLWDEGVPVCVLERIDRVGGGDGVGGSVGGGSVDRAGWESRVADVAVSRTDRVTVADWRCVLGLERRVVVWLADREKTVSLYYRLHALSRCTVQLIVVDASLPE